MSTTHKTQKVYGLVTELKTGGNGLVFAKIQDLNIKNKEVFVIACSGSSDNVFGDNDVKLEANMRVAFVGKVFAGEVVGSVITPKGDVKVYLDKKQKEDAFQVRIGLGNAVNVASAMLPSDAPMEDVFKLASDLYEPCKELRNKMTSEFSDREVRDVASKLGDSFKHAALRCDGTIEDMLVKAEQWLRLHIQCENGLTGE